MVSTASLEQSPFNIQVRVVRWGIAVRRRGSKAFTRDFGSKDPLSPASAGPTRSKTEDVLSFGAMSEASPWSEGHNIAH